MGKVTHGEGRCLGSGPGDLRRATMRDPYGVQGRLAAALGVSTSSVSYWRKGTHVPREEHWPLIEEFVDLPAGELGPPNATAPRPRRGNGPPRRRAVALTFPVLSPRAAKPLRSRRVGAMAR